MLLFLFELTTMAAEEAHSEFGPMEFWAAAGVAARGVVITLGAMFFACWFVFFERLVAFYRSRQQSKFLAVEISAALRNRDIEGALKLIATPKFKHAYLGSLLKAGLVELQSRLDRDGIENARRAIEKSHDEELAKLKSWMTVLATTGSTGPFVGLFGTTFGVINAFSGMAQEGSGLASISAGISEALYTTAIGIGVAVIGVWMFNLFNRFIEVITNELNTSEQDFLAWAEKLLQDPVTAVGK